MAKNYTPDEVEEMIRRISGHYINQMRAHGVEEDKVKKIAVAVVADELNWVVDNM